MFIQISAADIKRQFIHLCSFTFNSFAYLTIYLFAQLFFFLPTHFGSSLAFICEIFLFSRPRVERLVPLFHCFHAFLEFVLRDFACLPISFFYTLQTVRLFFPLFHFATQHLPPASQSLIVTARPFIQTETKANLNIIIIVARTGRRRSRSLGETPSREFHLRNSIHPAKKEQTAFFFFKRKIDISKQKCFYVCLLLFFLLPLPLTRHCIHKISISIFIRVRR